MSDKSLCQWCNSPKENPLGLCSVCGRFPTTNTTFTNLSQEEMKEKAKERPKNFKDLGPEEQWMIDKRLGILDWEGDP